MTGVAVRSLLAVALFLHAYINVFNFCLQLASSRGIEGLTNLDVFLVAREVEQSLACHDTSKCLSWCHDNKSKLRKLNSSLEFNVRMQEFIELIRGDRRMDAIR